MSQLLSQLLRDLDLMLSGACCVIDKWSSRVMSVKLSFRGRRANTRRTTKTARPQRPTFSLAAGGRQFCNRLHRPDESKITIETWQVDLETTGITPVRAVRGRRLR